MTLSCEQSSEESGLLSVISLLRQVRKELNCILTKALDNEVFAEHLSAVESSVSVLLETVTTLLHTQIKKETDESSFDSQIDITLSTCPCPESLDATLVDDSQYSDTARPKSQRKKDGLIRDVVSVGRQSNPDSASGEGKKIIPCLEPTKKSTTKLSSLNPPKERGENLVPVHDKFHCPLCGKSLKNKGCFESHLKRIHGEKKFQCSVCGQKYGLQSQLNTHVARDHEGRIYPCDSCGKTYKTKSAMISHFSSFHERIKHLCSACGKEFSREESLLSHKLYVHENRGSVCKICDRKFKRPESMHKHVSRVHKGKTFPCSVCGKELATPKSLKDHEQNFHAEEKNVFACKLCGKVKHTQRGLKLHVASVHEGKKFLCPSCPMEFSWHSLRRNHIRIVHEGVKFHCQLCGKNFSQGSALKTHTDSVHGKN